MSQEDKLEQLVALSTRLNINYDALYAAVRRGRCWAVKQGRDWFSTETAVKGWQNAPDLHRKGRKSRA